MYFPDYNNCILNVMGSIEKGFGGKPKYNPISMLKPEEIKKAKNVVLIVLDGLGYEYLIKYGKNSELMKYLRGKITSIFPAATTSCVPAFLTGMSAQEHGMAGWYIYLRELGTVICPLPGGTRFGEFSWGDKVEFGKLFNLQPFSNRINVKSYILNPIEFRSSAFNKECRGKAKLIWYKGLTDFFKKMGRIIEKDGRKYMYAYHSYPDSAMHEYGVESKKVFKIFNKIDAEFKKFINKIEKIGNTIVIVTADHGLITVPRKKWIDTNKYPKLKEFFRIPICGEGRMGYSYIKMGKEEEFRDFVKKELNFCCKLMKSEDAIKKGFFGKGKMHPEFENRIGDYLMIMKDNYGIKDFVITSDVNEQNLGRHGGVSKEEMFVPLIVVKTREKK